MIERIERIPGWDCSNPNEYELRVNGDKINVLYSSYGISLGWTGNKHFVAYSCNASNEFFFMLVKFNKDELNCLVNGKVSYYDWLWELWL